MRQISNNDFDQAVRLLRHLSRTKGQTLKEVEAARKATLLVKKFEKLEKTWQTNP